MVTTTPNKEKKQKNKSWEASMGLANLNRWQVESSHCQRFFFPLKTTKRKCYFFLLLLFQFPKMGVA
jgi:hypothetical protein